MARLGWLAVPVSIVALPAAIRSYRFLTRGIDRVPDGVEMWFMVVAPIATLWCCHLAYAAKRSWPEDVLVGVLLAGVKMSMWAGLLEALSI